MLKRIIAAGWMVAVIVGALSCGLFLCRHEPKLMITVGAAVVIAALLGLGMGITLWAVEVLFC